MTFKFIEGVTVNHAWDVDTWGADESVKLIQPADIGDVVDFIITRPQSVMIESIDLANPHQWRGSQAPWSPNCTLTRCLVLIARIDGTLFLLYPRGV